MTADDWKFYSIGRAEYKPFREKQEDEENTLFVPPIIPGRRDFIKLSEHLKYYRWIFSKSNLNFTAVIVYKELLAIV